MVTSATAKGEAIALGIAITMRVIDALKELIEGDRLATTVTSRVLVIVSLGVMV